MHNLAILLFTLSKTVTYGSEYHLKCRIYVVKVKTSRNRPGVAQRVPGALGSHIFMIFGT